MNRDILNDIAYCAGADTHTRTRRGPLPEQILVKPHLCALPDDDEDRDLCDGHTISAGGYIFEDTRADHIYYTNGDRLRAWLSEHGYTHQSNLENGYMATPGLTGIYSREV